MPVVTPPFIPQFGTGAPGINVPRNQLYYDASTIPYTPYVFDVTVPGWVQYSVPGGAANATSIQGVPVTATPPTNGFTLTFNSGSGDIEWLPAGGAPPASPGFDAARWYTSPYAFNATTTASYSANTMIYTPFYNPQNYTFNTLGFEVFTLVAASNVRVGLYSNVNGNPDTLISDFGSVSSATTGFKTVGPLGLVLASGWYWFATNFSANSIALRALSNGLGPLQGWGGATPGLNNGGNQLSAAQAFGAMPGTAPAASTGSTQTNPLMLLRRN